LLERAADEVDSAWSAIAREPFLRWVVLESCHELLIALSRDIKIAAKQGSEVAIYYIELCGESSDAPSLKGAILGLCGFDGPTLEARSFPDRARASADYLRRWLASQQWLAVQRLQSPPTPHVMQQAPPTENSDDWSIERSPTEWRKILEDNGATWSESRTWSNRRREDPEAFSGTTKKVSIHRRKFEEWGLSFSEHGKQRSQPALNQHSTGTQPATKEHSTGIQ